MVDYTQPLTEYDVTVTMARQPDRDDDSTREERRFTFTVPAASEEQAKRGGIDIGLGINEASGYQWKLADDEDGPKVSPARPVMPVFTTTVDEPVNTMNDHLVGATGGGVTITLPPIAPMPSEEAIRLAAWLVVCAGDHDAKRFGEVFKAVCNT